MSNYKDKDGFYHDKPCINGEPSSNNRYIYTAYGKYLAPEPSLPELLDRTKAFEASVISREPLKINRLPDKPYPPFSKDECVGLVSLGYINASDLARSHWNFCNLPSYTPEKLTFKAALRAFKTLFKIKVKAYYYLFRASSTEITIDQMYWLDLHNNISHRNYFWENNLEEAYCLAFLVTPEDRYYIKKFSGESPTLTETVIFYLNTFFTLTKGGKSAKMYKWLQLKDLDHFLLKFTNKKKYVEAYFEEDHDFRKGLE